MTNEIHPCLIDADLLKVSEMAHKLYNELPNNSNFKEQAFEISYMLEYLRLNFEIIKK